MNGEKMCRNIKPLFNFDPKATDVEIRAASIQFVRKVSGMTKPSKANEAILERAIDEITVVVTEMLNSMTTSVEPRNREIEAEKARARAVKRFGN